MLSYIEEHEAEEAISSIKNEIDFPLPKLDGDHIAVKIFIRPEELISGVREDGSEYKLYLPETIRAEDKYRNFCALVIAIGAACENCNYRIGDFLVIPRNEGTQFSYYGMVLHFISSKKIYSIIRCPTLMTKM